MPRTRTYGLDFDTIAYANRIKSGAGTVLSNEALKQINKFVIGIKRMKLWDKMVCWPMRSIHNAGTGSTVYSLGGLGVYDGTMVNSPMWGYFGLTGNGTNNFITTTLPDVGTNISATSCLSYFYFTKQGNSTIISSRKTSPSPTGGRTFGSWQTTNQAAITWPTTGLTAQANTTISSSNLNTWMFAHFSSLATNNNTTNRSESGLYKNTRIIAEASGTSNAGNLLTIWSTLTTGSEFFGGIMPILTLFRSYISKDQSDIIYDLFKKTIAPFN